MDRLALFQALGDPTRYALYEELAASAAPRSTSDLAEALGLHVNTVRPHLERLRDAGLVEVQRGSQGTVGRPQHRYTLVPDAPSLGLEPAGYPLLAGLLADLVEEVELEPERVAEVGRRCGLREARSEARGDAQGGPGPGCVEVLVAQLGRHGFDPLVEEGGGGVTVSFRHCPFRSLAEARPDLVCAMHRGLVEGWLEVSGRGRIARFATLADPSPCRVDVDAGSRGAPVG